MTRKNRFYAAQKREALDNHPVAEMLIMGACGLGFVLITINVISSTAIVLVGCSN